MLTDLELKMRISEELDEANELTQFRWGYIAALVSILTGKELKINTTLPELLEQCSIPYYFNTKTQKYVFAATAEEFVTDPSQWECLD